MTGGHLATGAADANTEYIKIEKATTRCGRLFYFSAGLHFAFAGETGGERFFYPVLEQHSSAWCKATAMSGSLKARLQRNRQM